jgi:hypothetical protein
MKRREPKLPKGPKPTRVTPAMRASLEQTEIRFAERVASMVLMRLRADAPQLFPPPPAPETPHA